jgi:hypothetical protein
MTTRPVAPRHPSCHPALGASCPSTHESASGCARWACTSSRAASRQSTDRSRSDRRPADRGIAEDRCVDGEYAHPTSGLASSDQGLPRRQALPRDSHRRGQRRARIGRNDHRVRGRGRRDPRCRGADTAHRPLARLGGAPVQWARVARLGNARPAPVRRSTAAARRVDRRSRGASGRAPSPRAVLISEVSRLHRPTPA